MNNAQQLEINDKFKMEQFDNEILLYSVADAMALYLNETAFMVYRMCSSGQSVGEIIALLEDAYPDKKKSIRGDVIVSLAYLVKNKALIPHE